MLTHSLLDGMILCLSIPTTTTATTIATIATNTITTNTTNTTTITTTTTTTNPNTTPTPTTNTNTTSGEILGFRIFPSILGPVFSVDLDTANEIIGGIGVDEGEGEGEGGETSNRVRYSNAVVRDLRMAFRLVQKMCVYDSWLDNFAPNPAALSKPNSKTKSKKTTNSDSHRMVNTFLTLYSVSCHRFCQDREVPVPMAWENRDKKQTAVARRFATQPLRNWLAQLQQKQVRAALKL